MKTIHPDIQNFIMTRWKANAGKLDRKLCRVLLRAQIFNNSGLRVDDILDWAGTLPGTRVELER